MCDWCSHCNFCAIINMLFLSFYYFFLLHTLRNRLWWIKIMIINETINDNAYAIIQQAPSGEFFCKLRKFAITMLYFWSVVLLFFLYNLFFVFVCFDQVKKMIIVYSVNMYSTAVYQLDCVQYCSVPVGLCTVLQCNSWTVYSTAV